MRKQKVIDQMVLQSNTSSSSLLSTVAVGIDLGSWNGRVASFDEALNHPVLIHNQDGLRATRVLVDQTQAVTSENLANFFQERLLQLAIDSAHSTDLNVVTSISSAEDVDPEWLSILKKFGGIITEAAAVCNAYDDDFEKEDGQKILILDGGASGLKATILQNTNGLLSRQMSRTLQAVNGTAVLDALAQSVAQQFEQKNRFPRGEVWESKKAKAKLRRACESGLKTLQINNTVTIHVDGLYEGVDCQVSISKPKWDHLSSKLATQAKQFLSKLPGVDLVLLSGNLHTWVKPIAAGFFKEKLVTSSSIDPSEAVALGCTRQAYWSLISDGSTEPTTMVKLSPVSIGIKNTPDEKEVTMIDQGTPLPAVATHALDGSSSIDIWQLHPSPKPLAALADLEEPCTLKVYLSEQGRLKIWVNGESLVIG
jgi:molecular chaperone DnaK (HSP70)